MREQQNIWRHLVAPIVLVATLVTIILLGQAGLIGDLSELGDKAAVLGNSDYGIPILIGMFCVGAYLGIPQFVLIAGAVISFGPWAGFGVSWLATLCSGTLTFWTGRFAGEGAVRRFGGKKINAISAVLGRNAFFASAIVRNVPAGPFAIVNMMFGASRARFLPFLGGMALGSLPKIALVAFTGKSLMAALAGSLPLAIAMVLGAVLLWFGLGWFSRRTLSQKGQDLPD